MNKRTAVAVGLAVGIAIGLISVAISEAATPARLFVSAKEFSLVLSRQSLRPGSLRIQLYNAGEDVHDLHLKRIGGTHTLRLRETSPGDVAELRTSLRAGRWKLWCSLPGHAKAGMRAMLVVRP
jgi:hypothetical protein